MDLLSTRESTADRIARILIILGFVLISVDFVLAFFVAPLVKGANLSETALIGGQTVSNKLLLSQKIFYFHVPVALSSFLTLILTAFYGARYLKTKERIYDTHAKIATEVVLVFVLMTMGSGLLWTRFEWGVWWVWEPRLTTYFILTLMTIGYFILRTAIDDPERRARLASVFGIIVFVNAPISFMITRLAPESSVHPVVLRTDSGLETSMLIPFLLGLAGMLLIAYGVYRLRLRSEFLIQDVEDLKERLERSEPRIDTRSVNDGSDPR